MMRNTKKAFTLVELIVVITILAILGTIAFISLQGYSGEAKNSKVTSDLRNIASAIETASTRNSVTLWNVLKTNTRVTTNNQVSSWTLSIGPKNLLLNNTASGVLYAVGNVDFASIGQNGEDFKDPNAVDPIDNTRQADYIFAMVTSPDFKAYQLAGQIIENDVKKARINGTFYTASWSNAVWLISSATDTLNTELKDGDSLLPLLNPNLY